MSYCRFSSDGWKSEVYAFEHVGGFWQIYVAGNRIVSELPPVPVFGTVPDDEWIAADRKRMEALDTCERVDIDLAHAGDSFEEPSAAACLSRLESLRALGYRVPQSAIDTLREEAAEVAP